LNQTFFWRNAERRKMFHLNRPRKGFYGSVAGEKSFDKAHRGFSGISPGNEIASTGCVS
jgi:hypothetical protein